MTRRSIGALALAALAAAALDDTRAAGTLDELRWLAGTWKRDGAPAASYETWRSSSDRTLEGEGWREGAEPGTRQVLETLLLVEMGGEIFYVAKVPENPYPVPFKLTSLADGRAVFENPGHDFPTRVGYERQADGSVLAWIEGPGQDAPRRIEFRFRRVD
jgi:hypothetical protein